MKLVQLKCPDCGAELKVDAEGKTAFCQYCGAKLIVDDEVQHVQYDNAEDAGYRFELGRMRAQREASDNYRRSEPTQPQTVIVNNYTIQQAHAGNAKNKWVAFILCLLFGYFGLHKFYEGKTKMGLIYLFTLGIFCMGWLFDIFALLFKPNPYYV